MGGLGAFFVDDLLDFYANTHRFDTGAATDADAVPAYRVYETGTATPILTGTMALLDSTNTAGLYQAQITLSAANGFEAGKSYAIYISAAVNAVTGTMHHHFRVGPVQANLIQWLGTAPLALTSQLVQTSAAALQAGIITAAAIATDAIQAAKIQTGAITAAKFAAGAIDAASIATDAITAAKIAANAIADTKIATGAFTAAKFAAGAFDAMWTVASRVLTAGTNIVLAKGTGVTGFNDLSAAQVNTEVDTALADVNLDHLVGTATGIPALPAGTYLDGFATDTELADLLIGPLITVVADGGNTATSFKIDRTTAPANSLVDAWLSFDPGSSLPNEVKRITAFNATTDVVTVHAPYTATPATGATARLVSR